ARRALESVLEQREVPAPAARAHVLVVHAALELVADAELGLDALQVRDLELRGERLAAARARRGSALRARAPVELERELRRPLEDVEELPERQVEQREDHRHRVELRQESVVEAVEEARRNGEQEPGRRDREEEHERQEIVRELLHGERSAIARAAPE